MKPTKLSPKTLGQIAKEYGIHRNTLRNKLKKKGTTLPRGLIMPSDVKVIYDALGWPPRVLDEES